MTKAVWRSALVAALFAWHPMHIQSVAWISERKDVLSGFFMMLTLWAYVKSAECGVRSAECGRQSAEGGKQSAEGKVRSAESKKYFYASLVFFALGLMSKPMLVTVPAILLLLDFWPLKRITDDMWQAAEWKKELKELALEKIPFVVLSLATVGATFWAQGGAGYIITKDLLPMPVRIANAPVFVMTYLEKLFWPANLAVFYPYQQIPIWEQAGSFLLLALLTVIGFRWLRSRPYGLVGWLWFLVMLLPVIGLVQVGGQSIADRYTYLPSIGIFIILVWGIGEIAMISKRWLAGVTIGATALLLACLLATQYQLKYWKNSSTLFRRAIEVTKENNSPSYFGLGYALWHEAGDLDGAVTNFKAALQAGSTYPWELDSVMTLHDLGCVLLFSDRPAEAEIQFRAALEKDPKNGYTHKYLGDALSNQGKTAESETEYDTAAQLRPEDTVLLQQIEASQTLAKLRETSKTGPTSEIYTQIAEIEGSQGMFRDAERDYLAALKLKPDSPDILNNLAWLLAVCPDQKVRDGGQAVQYAQRACDLTQFQQTICIGTLAAAYAAAGNFDDAMATAHRACDLATKNGETNLLQKNRELMKRYRRHQTASD